MIGGKKIWSRWNGLMVNDYYKGRHHKKGLREAKSKEKY